jgi:hypothetical protein
MKTLQEIEKAIETLALPERLQLYNVPPVSAEQVIKEFKELSPTDRARVARFVVENDDSWIPEEFKQGMADIAAGRVVDLDAALNEPYPGDT